MNVCVLGGGALLSRLVADRQRFALGVGLSHVCVWGGGVGLLVIKLPVWYVAVLLCGGLLSV